VIIMSNKRMIKSIYPIIAMLTGLGSFLISGVFAGLLSMVSNEGVMLILGIPLGSLIMLFVLSMLRREKVPLVLIRSVIGGFGGLIAGFLAAELAAGAVGFFFPSLNNLDEIQSQIIPNIILVAVMCAIYGCIMGVMFYGRKSILGFGLICAGISVPFGIFISMPIELTWIRFEQNLFIMLLALGTSTGFTLGLYHMMKLKNEEQIE